MNVNDKNVNNEKEHIDIIVGNEHDRQVNNTSKDFEYKMLSMMTKQTKYMLQIKNILTYFFWVSIILVVKTFLSLSR